MRQEKFRLWSIGARSSFPSSLQDVEVLPSRHLLPLLEAQLVRDVLQPLHLLQEAGDRKVAKLWNGHEVHLTTKFF